MRLLKNLDNKCFFLSDVFPDDILNNILSDIANRDPIELSVRLSYHNSEKNIQKKKEELSESDLSALTSNINDDRIFQKHYFYSCNHTEDPIIKSYYLKALEMIYGHRKVLIESEASFKYGSGHFMDMHRDGSSDRLCTTVLYLNSMTDYCQGGEIVFYKDNLKNDVIEVYRPERGCLIVFDSLGHPGMQHSVNKINNWDRYVHRVYWKMVS